MSKKITTSLNGKWILNSSYLEKPIEATVPGSVYNDLLNNNLIPDPFDQDNEYLARDIMKYDFEYQKEFEFDKTNGKHFLVFNGVDTLADIFLNNTLICSTDNMHRVYHIDVTDLLQKNNVLLVKIKSSLNYLETKIKERDYELFGVSDAVEGYMYIRKGSSMFGWDWGPQLPDAGIWRDVFIESINDCYIKDVLITQSHSLNIVKLKIDIDLELCQNNLTPTIEVIIRDPNKKILISQCFNKAINDISITITNPKLWYPVGYGLQPLYNVETRVYQEEEIIDQKTTRIGLREVKLIQVEDEYGESFTVEVNGIKVFAKGANYIPEDNILARTNYELTRDLLVSALEANHNMIRVWGGGIYPNDYFYDICDELGLLIWQDLMFACSIYDMNDDAFVSSIKHEIIDNIKRIRNHPSIALICGNNEIEMAIENWNIPNTGLAKEFYIRQYVEIFESIVKEYYPNMPYWRSSPASKELFKDTNSDGYGDMHYWGVWHSNEPITYYRKYFPRFMSEFGIQSFPALKTIKTFARDEDLNIFSYIMEQHQKNKTANSKILNYIGKMFKYPKDFENLLYVSQLIQAEGVRYGAEHWRRNHGRCMGILYWQLNDCWPVASWSSIDYYHRWKALHYFSKKFYQPILISIEETKHKAKIYLTNDTLESIFGTVNYKLVDLNGNIIEEASKQIELSSQIANKVYDLDFKVSTSEQKKYVLYTNFVVEDKIITDNYVSFVPDKYLKLENPDITFTLIKVKNGYLLNVETKSYAKYIEISCNNLDLRFSDNYFNLLPNQLKEVYINTNELINKDMINIKSLYDSY